MSTDLHLALFQPDIPQNTGTLMRLCACLGVAMDIIEPCGFVLSDKNLKRAGMDYLENLTLNRHLDWTRFVTATADRRLVALTTQASDIYINFKFKPDDILLLGQESAGLPAAVHAACPSRVSIPMQPGLRSLNVAVAGAMVLGEALRQTGGIKTLLS